MATHSSVLAWRIPWTEEPGGLLSIGSHRVRHDWSKLACMHALEKEMATHSSILAWKIPGTKEPGGLQSVGLLRVGYDWETSLSLFTFLHWRRKWQPTPVFLPGESQGRGSLVGCRLWGCTELDTTEATATAACRKINRWKGPDTENGNDYFTERRNLKNANAISGITIDRSYCFL